MKSHEDIKDNLIRYLQKAVRELQREYVSKREIIPSSELTNSLCYALEAIFLHGLFSASSDKTYSYNFWVLLSKFTHKSTVSEVDSLSQIKTDIGRCRAWIRLALSGCELESYIRLILVDSSTVRQYYQPWSFLCDIECMDLLLASIQGLESVRLCLGHNSTVLNNWSNTSLSLAGQLASSCHPNSPQSDLNDGVSSSFDDYELSPDDREEVRLMFRSASGLSFSAERLVSLSDAMTQTDFCTSSDIETQRSDCDNVLQTSDNKSSDMSGDTMQEALASNVSLNQRSLGLVDSRFRDGGHMTDSMRDLRFNRIVKENLEKYPLNYDRMRLQKEQEMNRSKDLAKQQKEKAKNEFGNHSHKQDSESEVTDPDTFWTKLKSDQFNEEIWSPGEPSDEDTPVQGNSLPKDTWIGPPVMLEFSAAPAFSANLNNQVLQELEASYGTVLTEYQKSVPQESRMVTAESAWMLFPDGGTINCQKQDLGRKNSQCTGVELEDGWVVISDDDECPFIAEPYHIDSSIEHLLPFVSQRFTEKTLKEQDYKCRTCSVEVVTEGRDRLCCFDGYSYCFDCHRNNKFCIPSQIVYEWDFKKYAVSIENAKFLKKIYDWPLLNIQELNPELYSISDELNHVRELRNQSYYLAGYMFHCESQFAVWYWKTMNTRLYYFSHVDNYSIRDLVNVHCGSFRKALKKINDSAIRHVYRCNCCRVRGFYCEICQGPDIIYPFEVKKTTVCEKCKNTYHERCKVEQELACPKCNRIQLRNMSLPLNSIDLVVFTHPADMTTQL